MKKIEDVIPLEYGLCPHLTAAQAKEYAAFLSVRYRKSLPSGCVIRLATQDELEAAMARQSTQARCERTGRDMKACVGLDGAVRRAKFAKLQNAAGLNRLGKWSDFGVNEDGFLISGLAMPHASGVCDLGGSSHPHVVIAPSHKETAKFAEEWSRGMPVVALYRLEYNGFEIAMRLTSRGARSIAQLFDCNVSVNMV